MPRKQGGQTSRKRLWFNVVEFDKETGRPLWRNKKTKLENDLPPCITNPTFTALLDKLREETECALGTRVPHEETKQSCSMVWRNDKSSQFQASDPSNPSLKKHNLYRNTTYQVAESSPPKLLMQFQHFSPLIRADNKAVDAQNRQIHEILKMKSFSQNCGVPHRMSNIHCTKNVRRNFYQNEDAYVPDSDVLANDWENTVRLHHLDFNENKSYTYQNTADQKVPLAIF